jgi:DNA-binding CsgD family transcriptional regulator
METVPYPTPTGGPSRASKSARAPGVIPRRCLVSDTRDQSTRLDRGRGLAWLFPHAQHAHRRAVRKGAGRGERQIVLVLSAGATNREIGRRLRLAEGTVKVHLHHIYRKLGIADQTALAVLVHTPLMRLSRYAAAVTALRR